MNKLFLFFISTVTFSCISVSEKLEKVDKYYSVSGNTQGTTYTVTYKVFDTLTNFNFDSILNDFDQSEFPLLFSMLDAICNNKKLSIKWE